MKILIALVILMILASGCSIFKKRVAPYEREVLAKPGMNFIENPEEETGMQHMFNAREGSVGGFGGAGGGCGCN
jgi:uncharacterized protein YceK